MNPLPVIVIDASAAAALVLSDEAGEETEQLLRRTLDENGQIYVPELFWYEMGNVLLSALRRSRITDEQAGEAMRYLSYLPIISHSCSDWDDRRRILDVARQHDLSFYDAAYLEIALRYDLPLKTLDRHLLALKERYPQIR